MRLEPIAIFAFFLAGGCSSGDPGEILGGPRAPVGNVYGSDAGAADSAPVEDIDAAVDAPMTPRDPFAGAGVFAPKPVDVTAEQEHRRRGVLTFATGTECLSCHDGAKAVRFTFAGTIGGSSGDGGLDAGTIDAGPDGGGGVADLEVRVVDYKGALLGDAHSDVDGNFWFASTTSIHGWGWAGVRSATTATKMPAPLPKGGCSSSMCHDANNRLRAP